MSNEERPRIFFQDLGCITSGPWPRRFRRSSDGSFGNGIRIVAGSLVGTEKKARGLPILHLDMKGRSQVKGAEQPRKARKA
jgi:hypothetical protein